MNKKKGTLMIQGTASDAGKSLFVTALCRIFARKGIKTVPFKAWNMSLNSYITKDGREIGIAQALQARAAFREVAVEMQPILVKAMGDGRCQIIINGQVDQSVNYQKKKNDYLRIYKRTIKEALKRLRQENDLIIMEGAGSPAEINRTTPDFANMFTAEIYKSPVLLISSIEKGGCLAALVGTLKLLPPAQRKLVKGLIINKFRGDFDLLKPAVDFLENYTEKEFLGVLPYLKDLNLPEEDSASLKLTNFSSQADNLKAAVIKLPHLSNFTDFNSLKMEKNLSLEYVENKKNLLSFDLIIIPGTKTTTKDLKFLKESGLAAEIKKADQAGIMIIGICGGFQMLGRKLVDKYGTEGNIKEIEGLGLLDIKTKFLNEKTTHQVKVKLNLNLKFKNKVPKFSFEEIFRGYEIHMGQTEYLNQTEELFKITERSGCRANYKDGAVNQAGNCFGSYLHGLFDNDNFRSAVLNKLRKNNGSDSSKLNDYNYQKEIEKDIDHLADVVAENIDTDKLLNLSRR
ncbi:adenosylcobyric acid synthase (glutamine-hydrolysing) [Halanaerobium saccharolyticum]|uniref:Cobyric acid synthase n=1 Tax=Halanaerobium saccharolyticum TaxID=43595 RepID=A0A4R7Z7B2_9FIRM|nr:cobyric acid synthase [Halanaerobium saccharolyticum]RAK10597.1 adenosylcobyric acid synthase (glutamine-hydrolysing) [Halanaerobium saccharolyticum]TDW06646.1 adenosylcobyric acid synthase (glutamine-hydrolysing) [Halanaerobium saccharolyticum]TDX62281.1 adenosylcobyric acid synthase (glutamine-hydrolysing) [Halanaerobium saccharolyticum]